MSFDVVFVWALNGLASASGLFFIAAGLSLIFGVTRIINIAHGSLYMLGIYLAYTFATRIGGGFGFWGGIVAAALIVACIGAPRPGLAGWCGRRRKIARWSARSVSNQAILFTAVFALGSFLACSAGSQYGSPAYMTLVAEFIVMAVVLIIRPHGLLGRAQGAVSQHRPG